MATKGKSAVKAAAAAPAPVAEVEQVEQTEGEIAVGSFVQFNGYGEEVPEAERVLTEGEQYEVVAISEDEGELGAEDFIQGGNPIVSAPNPNYNSKKKEHPETNPAMIEIEVFAEEITLVGEEVEQGEEAAADAAPVQAPAPAPKAKAAAKAAAPAPAAKTTAKAAAAPAAKAKPAAAAAKPKAKAAPAAEEIAETPADELPDLENEDADVLALVEGSEDLVVTAQELEARVGATEFQLGGVLYHMKKKKAHLSILDDAGKPIAAYAEKGGFAAFMKDYFNVDYRKAMYLIEIYVNFTQAGIENPAERVSTIGWTKASKIAKHLVGEGAKPDELLELAENNTTEGLSEAIKDSITIGGTKGEPGQKVQRVTFKFRLFEAEGKHIEQVLSTVMEQHSLKNLDDAFQYVVTEWANANGGGQATAQSAPAQTAKPVAKAAAPKRAAVKA